MALQQLEPGGSGGTGFAVAPEQLEQAGRTAQETAAAVPGETGGVLAASDRAENGLRGWRTAIELNACTDEWKRLLDDLSREMDSQGGKLIRTAANYRKGEDEANQGLGTAGSDVRARSGPAGPPAPTGTGTGTPGRANPLEERLLRNAFDGRQVTTQPHLLPPEQAARPGQAPGRDPRLDFQVHHVEQTADPDSFDLNAPARGL
ncbi:hypothetical protein HUT16_19835 [Kitasatospora sp. NA04385]|uniref:hypothetical protein n=1 Tax=Kitasatospora sp. NA04385 TaxID=2742135 RepID=UPI0015901F27|nr:hypothetical protein [Kitasatospora sp. NA04385]QKW21005.1 hypothetical protein HUT16_19835 [Kitasatospora sp. NA04385]